jgi:hypothetical protein
MVRRGRIAITAAFVVVAAGTLATMLVIADNEQTPRPNTRREAPDHVAVGVVGADCARFGQAAFPERLRRSTNLAAGPLTFASLGDYAAEPASTFEPVGPAWLRQPWVRRHADASLRTAVREGSLYVALKVIVLIEGWRDVTVAIPASHTSHAGLLWGPQPDLTPTEDRLGVRELSDGNPIVRFQGCRDQVMEYVGGGFVVAGPRCLPLDIHVEETTTPLRLTASFGQGTRCIQTPVEH